MPPPRVEVGRVGLDVPGRRPRPVRVENELVGGEEEAAEGALDALGSGGVVARRQKEAAAAPGALVVHGEREVVREAGRRVVPQEGLAQALGFPPRDHAAPPRRHRHGACSMQNTPFRTDLEIRTASCCDTSST